MKSLLFQRTVIFLIDSSSLTYQSNYTCIKPKSNHLTGDCPEWPRLRRAGTLCCKPTSFRAEFKPLPSKIEDVSIYEDFRAHGGQLALPNAVIIYSTDQECRHISSKVKALRINKKGDIAPCVIEADGKSRHLVWPIYGETMAARFRFDDWKLYKLVSRGLDSDHYDTVEDTGTRKG